MELNEGGERVGLYSNAMTQDFNVVLNGFSGIHSDSRAFHFSAPIETLVRVIDSVPPC